jgi:hypothetical protein
MMGTDVVTDRGRSTVPFAVGLSAALEAGASNVAYGTLWDNVRLVEGPATMPAVIDLDPGTLNLGSNGRWVTCYLELDEGYDVAQIDGATVRLDGIPA